MAAPCSADDELGEGARSNRIFVTPSLSFPSPWLVCSLHTHTHTHTHAQAAHTHTHTHAQAETNRELAATKARLAATNTTLTQTREELGSTAVSLRAVTQTTRQRIAQLTTDLVNCACKSRRACVLCCVVSVCVAIPFFFFSSFFLPSF